MNDPNPTGLSDQCAETSTPPTTPRISAERAETRRGRPPAFDPAFVDHIRSMFPELKSERAIRERCWTIRAMRAVRTCDAAKWVCDFERCKAGDDTAWRPAVLAALGRFDDDETIVHVAGELAALAELSDAALVRLIRDWVARTFGPAGGAQ